MKFWIVAFTMHLNRTQKEKTKVSEEAKKSEQARIEQDRIIYWES